MNQDLVNRQVSNDPSCNRRFPELTGEDNLTVFSYSGRVKSLKGGGSGEEPISDSFRSSGIDLL